MRPNITPKEAVNLSIGSLVAASSATAAIQYVDDAGYTTPSTVTPSGLPWDIDNDGTDEMQWFNTNTVVDSLFASQLTSDFAFMINASSLLPNLPSGYMIEETGKYFTTYANPMINNAFYLASGFTDGVEGIFGFKFNDGSGVVYGWAHVTFDLVANTATVSNWAYEDTGAAIAAGDTGIVPEPETAALGLAGLALGVAGLSRWRKRKQAA